MTKVRPLTGVVRRRVRVSRLRDRKAEVRRGCFTSDAIGFVVGPLVDRVGKYRADAIDGG